jgi:hypothetical protein
MPDEKNQLAYKLQNDTIIQAVFSKNDIEQLAKLRQMVDKMVLKQTGEKNTNTAYIRFVNHLKQSKTTLQLSEKIKLSHDSVVLLINTNSALGELFRIDEQMNHQNQISLNLSGKMLPFVKKLSGENPHYSSIHESILIAGDISPSVISDFIFNPESYNLKSEAEKLYASLLIVVLTNQTVMKKTGY